MLEWMVENTIAAGLLAIIVAAVCRVVRPRPAFRHALWLVVLVKLVVPPLPYISWTLPEEVVLATRGDGNVEVPPATKPTDTAPRHPNADDSATLEQTRPLAGESAGAIANNVMSAPVFEDLPVDLDKSPTGMKEAVDVESFQPARDHRPAMVIESIEYLPVEAQPEQVSPNVPNVEETAAVATTPSTGWWTVLASEQANRFGWFIWLFLVLSMALFEAGRVLRFRRMVRRARRASPWLVRQVEETARQLGVHAPEVLVTRTACSPVLWTLGPARLLWPERLTARLSTPALRAVIVHELAHLARRDHWVRRLELAAGCGWWWHPLFWIVRRMLRDSAEMACDAWVVSAYPGARKAYAQALIEVIGFSQPSSLPASALGVGGVTRRTFERRLKMIMRERVPSRLSLAAGAVLLLACVAVLPGWSRGQDAASSGAAGAVESAPETTADVASGLSEAVGESAGILDPAAAGEGNAEDTAATNSTSADSYGNEAEAAVYVDDVADYGAEPAPRSGRASNATAYNDEPLASESRVSGTVTFNPAISAFTVAAPDVADGDQNDSAIRRLENQLEKLMSEVRALRSATQHPPNLPARRGTSRVISSFARASKTAAADVTAQVAPAAVAQIPTESAPAAATSPPLPSTARSVLDPDGASVVLGGRVRTSAAATRYRTLGATQVKMLTRITYRLPQGKSQALAEFIGQHAGDRVETKVKGDSLVVTAAEEDQVVVGQFLGLIAEAAVQATELGAGDAAVEETEIESSDFGVPVESSLEFTEEAIPEAIDVFSELSDDATESAAFDVFDAGSDAGDESLGEDAFDDNLDAGTEAFGEEIFDE